METSLAVLLPGHARWLSISLEPKSWLQQAGMARFLSPPSTDGVS